ncbi:MAG: hypothetical protein KDK70_39715 [Myxococcales bacterium]|nr:hypothetical protein [Myxococcales bacterium]
MVGPPGDTLPANVLIFARNCDVDLPLDHLQVTVDGVSADLVSAGLEVGPTMALLRISPLPQEGQTVELDGCGCGGSDCVPITGPTQWVAGPADDQPPTATVTGVTWTADEVQADGVACPPYGPRVAVELLDPAFDDDVAMIRVELAEDGMVLAGGQGAWDPVVPGPPPTLWAEASGTSCVRAHAMDRAGNEAFLGPIDCVAEASFDGDTGTLVSACSQGGGCSCRSDGSPQSPWLVLLTLGLLGPRRRS